MKKKIISVFLCFSLLMAIFPMNAIAEDSLVEKTSGTSDLASIAEDSMAGETSDTSDLASIAEDSMAGETSDTSDLASIAEDPMADETSDTSDLASIVEDSMADETSGVSNLASIAEDPLAEETPVTKELASLLTNVELVGVEKAEDGSYYVPAGQRYLIKLSFQENINAQLDMSDYIRYELPAGAVTNDTSCTVEIGVYDVEIENYTPIVHNCTISNNIVTITWNKDHEAFADLFRSPNVRFDFYLHGMFDGSVEEVRFEDGSKVIVEVDSLGLITVNKTVTGLKPDATLTDEEKQEMLFELRNANGQAVKTFSYADMENGTVTYTGMPPGEYTVLETGHPSLSNYTFDPNDSVITKSGTLSKGGVLTLSLLNDYDFDKGNLELKKIINCTNWDDSSTVPDSIKNSISFTVTGPYGYSKTVAYNDFVNGKYTLTNLEVGEYTINETDDVIGYTCTYKVNNVAMDMPTTAAMVTKGDTVSVSFENIYTERTANLTIMKTASGAAVPANAEFTVTFPDGIAMKSFKYSDMINGKYSLSNVPFGTYEVTENKDSAQVPGYTLTVTGEGDVTLSQDQTKEIHNAYSFGGTLIVNKSILGDLTSADLTDEKKEAMKFTVSDASGTIVGELTYADILDGETLSLPAGTYTVEESGADIRGYSLKSNPTNRKRTVSVSEGETAVVSFTNTYTRYSFTVVKRCAEGSDYSLNDLPDSVLDNTIIAVRDNTMNRYIWRDTLREFLKTPDGMAVEGYGMCSIIETNPEPEDIPGVGIATRISVDGGDNYTDGEIAGFNLRETPQGVNIIIENNYTLQGVIKGDKTLVGLSDYEESQLRGRITFSIYRENAGVYSLYKENVTLAEMEDGITVPVGNYYVQETGSVNVSEYSGPDVKTQVDSGTVKEGSSTDNFPVTMGSTVTVHFTNTYSIGPGAGTIELAKYVKGLDEIGTSDEIVLTNALEVENTEGQLLYDGIQFRFEILIDSMWHEYSTYALSDFINGVRLVPGHYRMTELNGNVDGYLLHVDYLIKSENEGGTEQKFNEEVELDITASQTLEFEVHNVYTKVGNLKITKTTAGDITASELGSTERKKIVFKVTGPFSFEETFTYDDFYSTGIKEFSSIPIGTYTITETAGDTENYLLTVSSNLTGANAPKSGTVNVSTGNTTQVDFINTYAYKTGTLIIQKTLDGDIPETLTEAQKKAMTFEVCSGEIVKYTATYDQFENGSYTFTNVPTGSYTVVETIGEVLTDEYNIDITGNNVSAVVSYGGTKTVTIENTFTKTGSLKLVKAFDGVTISQDEMEKVAFTYWQVGANNEKIGETTVTYAEFMDGCYTVNGLMPGNYTVKEEDNETGYMCTTTVKVNDGTAVTGTKANAQITSNACTTVAFTNTYAERASLLITKVNEGALTHLNEDQAKAIVFTILDSEGNTVAIADWYYLEGRTFSKMVPGEYTIRETINDPDGDVFGDYSISTKYKIGTAESENGSVAQITIVPGENTIVFTNTYTKIERLRAFLNSSKTYVGTATIDDAKYPIWKFTLSIRNLNPLMTVDGSAVFANVFDTTRENSLFRLATKDEVSEALGCEEQNTYITSKVIGKKAPTAMFDEYSNAIIISNVTADTADKCDFTYYLIVKDSDALKAINSPLPDGSGGAKLEFNNKITYYPLPNNDETEDTEAVYEYSFTAVSKNITNLDEQGILYQMIGDQKIQVNYVDYSITLNEDGVTIGDQPTIVATDTFSDNQVVLPSSITTDPSDGVGYTLNNDEHKIVFTIPNSTPVAVSYRANILGGQDPVHGTVRLMNSIDFLGFSESVDKTVEDFWGGNGQGEVYSVRISKVDSLDDSIGLEGVKFALYDGLTDERLTDGTTDASGQIRFKYWGTAGALRPDYTYYIKEESTISGYNLSSEKIWFRITDSVSGNDGNVILLINGAMLVRTNEPVATSFDVTKIFNDWTRQGAFSFKLEALEGAPMPEAGGDIAVATEANPTASFGLIRFPVSDEDFVNDKVVKYHYTIQEVDEKIAGITYDTTVYPVTVVISDHGNDGIREISVYYGADNKNSLTITNWYYPDEGTLTVRKTIAGNSADPAKAFSFTVKLSDTFVNGMYGDMYFLDGVSTFSLKDGESKTAKHLPHGVSYAVTEADYSDEGYVTTKTGDTGTISADVQAIAAFTNTKNVYGNLSISKNVTGNLGDRSKYFTFKVEFDAPGTFSYSGSSSGTISSGGIIQLRHGESVTIVGLPAGTHYSVTEGDNNGYTVYASGDAGIVPKNNTVSAVFTNTRSDVPKTGDDSHMPLWLSLMGISCLGMTGTAIDGDKRRRKSARMKNK